ncbi:uncharacterized protein [Anabrus simplex]|uniref:uncharacterized protein n=1 Tax=Anabrus simplex TaxID=316456 RepID=UPI0034DD578F
MSRLVYLVLVSVCVLLSVTITIAKSKEFRDKMKTAKANCKAAHGVPEDEMRALRQNGPQSEEGKCFVGCMMQSMGIIDSGGSFDSGKAEEWANKNYPAGDKREQARTVIDTCQQQVTSSEICETGAELFDCFKKNGFGLFTPGKK